MGDISKSTMKLLATIVLSLGVLVSVSWCDDTKQACIDLSVHLARTTKELAGMELATYGVTDDYEINNHLLTQNCTKKLLRGYAFDVLINPSGVKNSSDVEITCKDVRGKMDSDGKKEITSYGECKKKDRSVREPTEKINCEEHGVKAADFYASLRKGFVGSPVVDCEPFGQTDVKLSFYYCKKRVKHYKDPHRPTTTFYHKRVCRNIVITGRTLDPSVHHRSVLGLFGSSSPSFQYDRNATKTEHGFCSSENYCN